MSFKMPWASGSTESRPNANKADVSLHDILPTGALRIELILLVVLCTDKMREKLTSAFEIRHGSNQSTTILPDDNFPLTNLEEDNNRTQSNNFLQRSDTTYIRNMALYSSEMQSLKTAALSHFNAWRTAVLRRLGETLKVQPDSVKRAKARYSTAKEERARARQHRDYLDWAEGRDMSASTKDTLDAPGQSAEMLRTNLNELDAKTRALILNATLFILLSLEHYPAHSRVLLTQMSHNLDLPDEILTSAETTLAATLQQSTEATTETNKDDASKVSTEAQSNNRWKVGLATIAGATLIGVTGGLAAPFLLGAAGAIMGGVGLGGLATLLGATIANPVTVAALFGVLGGKMSKKAMEEFAKDVEDFELVPVYHNSKTEATRAITKKVPEGTGTSTKRPSQQERQTHLHMRVALGISGHILSYSDVTQPWTVFSPNSYDPFALRYELSTLLKLGTDLTDILRSSGYALAQGGALQLALPALSAALLPVSLLKLGSILDNPFSIAMQRSDKAGIVLAEALIAKMHGARPITLVGSSLGARVIYSCLCELAKRGAFGIVETAVLIGAPVPSDQAVWVKMRAMVVGRLVNVYTTDDMLLGYLYRVRYAQVGVAGLEAIAGVESIESFDVTALVRGHGQYRLAVGRILKEIQLDGLDQDRVEAEERVLEKEDKAEKEVHEQARRNGTLKGQEDDNGRIVMVDAMAQQEHKQKRHTSRSTSSGRLHHQPDEAEESDEAEDTMVNPKLGRSDRNNHHSKHHAQATKHQIVVPDEDEDNNRDSESEEEDEDQDLPAIQMINLDPTPEAEAEAEVKSRKATIPSTNSTAAVRFGSPHRGSNV